MVAMSAPLRPRFFFSLIGFALLLLVRGAMESGRVVQRVAGMTSQRSDVLGVTVVMLIALVSMSSLPYNYKYPKSPWQRLDWRRIRTNATMAAPGPRLKPPSSLIVFGQEQPVRGSSTRFRSTWIQDS